MIVIYAAQIFWTFGILILCGFSIWQIIAIDNLDPPPSQPFMKLNYPDQNAKFRHGAVENGAMSNRVTGIDGVSQRRDIRVFLIVITTFAVPAAVFSLAKSLKNLIFGDFVAFFSQNTDYLSSRAALKRVWMDSFYDFVIGV